MTKRKQTQIAKEMFRNSLKNGFVSTSMVHKNLTRITKLKPQGLIGILRIYKRLMAEKLKQETVIVETAASPTRQKQLEKEILQKTRARKVVFKSNPQMVFGAKIINGDWILEDSLKSKLNQLTKLWTINY